MKKHALHIVFILAVSLLPTYGFAQQDTVNTQQNDEFIMEYVVVDGDTILLDETSVVDIVYVPPRPTYTAEENALYNKYRRKIINPYPFALEIIKIYKEYQYVTQDLSKKKTKRYVQERKKELAAEFKDPLKDLTRKESLLLIKMVERELDITFFELIAEVRGKFSATKWQTAAKLWKLDLKGGYESERYPQMERVFLQYSFDVQIDTTDVTR